MKIRVRRQEHKPAFLSHADAQQAWLEGEVMVVISHAYQVHHMANNPRMPALTDHCESAEAGYNTVQIESACGIGGFPDAAPLTLEYDQDVHWCNLYTGPFFTNAVPQKGDEDIYDDEITDSGEEHEIQTRHVENLLITPQTNVDGFYKGTGYIRLSLEEDCHDGCLYIESGTYDLDPLYVEEYLHTFHPDEEPTQALWEALRTRDMTDDEIAPLQEKLEQEQADRKDGNYGGIDL